MLTIKNEQAICWGTLKLRHSNGEKVPNENKLVNSFPTEKCRLFYREHWNVMRKSPVKTFVIVKLKYS
jgi:hypothetical protein